MQAWLMFPWSNPYAPAVGLVLGGVFGGAGVALGVVGLVHRIAPNGARRGSSMQPVLWQRYRTWAMLAPLFAGAALAGPLGLAALVLLIGWLGAREFARLFRLPRWVGWVNLAGLTGTLIGTLVGGNQALLVAPVAAFGVWSALALLPADGELAERWRVAQAGQWGFLYLSWLPAHLFGLANGPTPGLVLAVGLGVAFSDVGAFCAGKAIGGPKLAPKLSPNKTWGGFLGNLGGAALALALIAFALPDLQVWQGVALALAIGLGSVWGDLLESLLKRQSGVKDAGTLLPGFGGLLDRVDSLLLVAPLVYYLGLVVF